MLKWLTVAALFILALLVWLGLKSTWAQKLFDTAVARKEEMFSAGLHVTISPEHRWAKGAVGTIAEPPPIVRKNVTNWQGVFRTVQGVHGPLTFYWVYFDQPQEDTEGDGPFIGAEIESTYLRPSSSGGFRQLDIPNKVIEAVWYENKQTGLRVSFKAFVKGTLKSQEAEVHFHRGEEAFSGGQYDQAISHYSKALEIYPRYFGAYNNRGLTYFKKKQYDQALSDYNKALEIDPNLAEAYGNRGLLYLNTKQNDQAISDLNKALEIKPKDAEAYVNRGLAHFNNGEYERAISDYNRALEIDPKNARGYTSRGSYLIYKGQPDQAIADFNKALEINPSDGLAYSFRGLAHYSKKEYSKALDDVTKAQELGHTVSPKFLDELRKASGETVEKDEFECRVLLRTSFF